LSESKVLEKDELPGAAIGDRVMLLPDPPKEETDYKIHIPDIAQHRPSTGVLLDAGLSARDKLHDHGIEIGDHVMWGKFAGVIYEWDHIHKHGKKPCDEHQWARIPSPRDRVQAGQCEKCEAVRWTECIILANVDDIQVSVELMQRRCSGQVKYVKGATADGATCHTIEREGV